MTGNKLNMFGAIRFLSKYLKPFKEKFVLFYLGWLIDRVCIIILPIMFGVMIDEIVYYKNIHIFMQISLVVVIISVFSCILYFFIYALHHYLMNMYTFSIKMDIFKKIQNADAISLSDKNTGDMINLLMQYSMQCMHFIIRNIIHNINNIISLVFYIVYSFIINWQFGIFMIVSAPFVVIVSTKYGDKIRKNSQEQRELYGTFSGRLFEFLSGLKDIRLLNAKKNVIHFFVKNIGKLFHIKIKHTKYELTAQNIIEGLNLLVQLLIYSLAMYLAMRNRITIGSLTVILAYFIGLKNSLTLLSRNYLDAQMRISMIQRIHDFLEISTEDNWQGKKELHITKGDIVFKNVKFSYDGKTNSEKNNIIDDFSLKINAGEHFALVGKSGCGKTTIAFTLIGFYILQGGEILIDGQRLSDFSLKSIRANIGIVQQSVLIFEGSIKENLLLGNHNANDEDIRNACRNAGIWDFIKQLPEGIETVIGNDGIDLSGGQKQRLAIARIYLKNPKIIIFDEATSSLDENTEKQIHDAWNTLLKGRTALIIAHRHNSVMLCDKVGIMEKGRLVETGLPQELNRKSDVFKELFAIN